MTETDKVVITGGAGLVGQNLIHRLRRRGVRNIVSIDRARRNSEVLARLQPGVDVVVADLVTDTDWEEKLGGCDALVVGHAQIGGLNAGEFVRNNLVATERLVEAAKRNGVKYLVNISSSVVNSQAVDHYTETKKDQEKLVLESGIPQVVLRPTLMFGWFDRKHLGWLGRFMERAPVFPIPGNGRYMRQPLYVGDFCEIVIASIERRVTGTYNISGQQKIDYVDLVRALRSAVQSEIPIVKVPYSAFWLMLAAYGAVQRNPPFTTKQLQALVTPDEFEVIDWPGIFGVRSTPLDEALAETYRDPTFSRIVLEF